MYTVKVTVHSANDLLVADITGSSDPFVEVRIGQSTHKTKVIKKDLNPVWNEKFEIVTGTLGHLYLTVYDWDKIGSNESIGKLIVPLEKDYTVGEEKQQKLKLKDVSHGTLSFSVLITKGK